MTKHWFTCKVKYVRHDAEGAEVKATESFVLDAYNYTEAESRMTGICENEGIRPFEIVQITKSNLSEVIRFEDADKWFKVKIALTSLDEQKGVEKESYQHVLLSASDVRDAYDKVQKHMSHSWTWIRHPFCGFPKNHRSVPSGRRRRIPCRGRRSCWFIHNRRSGIGSTSGRVKPFPSAEICLRFFCSLNELVVKRITAQRGAIANHEQMVLRPCHCDIGPAVFFQKPNLAF